MRSFFSWYGEATGTLRAADRLKRAAEHEGGKRDPVESLSIDWDAWHAENDDDQQASQSDQPEGQKDQQASQSD